MTHAANRRGWTILPAYLLAGLFLGLADAQLRMLIQELGVRPGWATAISVNLIMPLAAVGLAIARPRLRSCWLGAFGMTAAFLAGLAVAHPPGGPIDVASLLRAVPPIMVVACVAYGVLGTLAAVATRRLSQPDERWVAGRSVR